MPAPTPAIDQLEVAVTALESAVATPAEVSSPEALFEALVPIRRRLDAVSARLAARASDQLVHQRSGHKDEVQWLARTAGVSRRMAKDQLDTEKLLADLPVLRDARRRGQLSDAQADLVARAGHADPARQNQLLGAAKREDLKGLKDECDRIIAGADHDQSATYRRVKQQRSVKTWRQHDGTHCLLAKGTADDIAVLDQRIEKQARAVARQARAVGRREAWEAYRFDALLQLTDCRPDHEQGGDLPAVVPPWRDLLILIDYSAAKRGAVVPGERCEIAGVGPIPVDVALDFDADPFIKAVIRDGTDIKTVIHYGRSVPAELRTALEARGLRCAVPGCSNTAHLEIDHALVDYADGGPLALWNAQYLCTYHHRLKTLGQLEPLPPPGDPPPAEAADPSEADALTRPPPGSPP